MRIDDFRLYLITDRHQTGVNTLTDVVRMALESGVRAVQLREKDLPTAELYRLAMALRRLTNEFNAMLIINERLDVALAVGADGVHIGISSLPVADVRRVLGNGGIIGYSAHDIDEALRAQADGADFVTFGPLFPTPSKLAYGKPCGVKILASVSTAMEIPVLALGGISEENIAGAFSAGIEGIAVISAVMAAADPRSASVSLLKKIEMYAKSS